MPGCAPPPLAAHRALLLLFCAALAVAGAEAWQAQQAAALAALCASCTGLRRLIMHGWSLPEGGLQPLASLSRLQALELCNVAVPGGGPARSFLPPLPLRHLRYMSPQVGLEGEACRGSCAEQPWTRAMMARSQHMCAAALAPSSGLPPAASICPTRRVPVHQPDLSGAPCHWPQPAAAARAHTATATPAAAGAE